MTSSSQLRLVIGQADHSVPTVVEFPPPDGGTIHLHVHVTIEGAPGVVASEPAVQAQQARTVGSRGRPALLFFIGLAVAVALNVGLRTGHAPSRLTEPAALSAGPAHGPAVPPPWAGPAGQDQMPAIQQQLARPPTIVNPPGAAPEPGKADAFGLQR